MPICIPQSRTCVNGIIPQNCTPAPGGDLRMSRGRGAPSRAEPWERYGVAAAPFVGGFTRSR